MSAQPPLPPPPPANNWAQAAAPGVPPTPNRPGWRQGRPGYVLLNLVIGFGVAIGAFFIVAILISLFRPEGDPAEANDALFGWSFLLAFLGGLVGWIFFTYLEGPLRRRWIAFAAILGGSALLSLVLLLRAVDVGGGTR